MTGETRRPFTVPDLQVYKARGQRIVATTAYDSCTAQLAAPLVDVLLVGDSVGNVCLGMDGTNAVSMAMMNHHLDAVVRVKTDALVVADMPYLSYHINDDEAVRNAGNFIQRGAAAIKLEGGAKRARTIARLIDAEIPVMGHLGLTPQSQHMMGGFKVQGKSAGSALAIMDDACRLQEAGCFAIVLEGVPGEVAARITDALDIPTIGIGAGAHCSGQVLVLHDVLGLLDQRRPKFVRAYMDGLGLARAALGQWADDVRTGKFPGEAETYALPEDARAAVHDWRPPTKN
ncbi:3-methyl-2-oxobutanoate hydroxymethyltransferase [Methylovirgula sp. 4M-Z18]|uniref:3-methyl-2-oxobutanoate hydroxymethyltransferase n=1 Tax=Methylovirgula sp. 4M-Z18 TaxID=2293567 RepID=UPI000E2EE359|nr:3-methyl-2-oxobutanoate hydroxymethyltransferase [Methylovirgula sp. 4M-Z18]RFB80873.1 3-methyl-2-oxobutanoate hydroxymethyltransferase [Methylovirgula sp. 4M-Z18]